MKSLPLLVLLVIVLVGFTLVRRSRQRVAGRASQAADNLTPGAEVMTTSGLYATVVGLDVDAGTAVLSISPGVEVTWAVAALRAVADLPDRYRPGGSQPAEAPEDDPRNDGVGPQSGDGPADPK